MKPELSKNHLEAWRLFITSHDKLISLIDRELTATQQIPLHWYDVLVELAEASDHRLRMHELAQQVVLSRSGLTRLVDRLEKARLIRREADPTDRRGFFAILTDEGVAALEGARPVYMAALQKYFADHLTNDEAEMFTRVLRDIVQATRHI